MKKWVYNIGIIFVVYCFVGYQWTKHRGPIVIYSDVFLDIGGAMNGFKRGKAKGMVGPPPFIFLRNKTHEMNDIRINHERIHQLQLTETLFLLACWSQGERLYAKWLLGKTPEQAYLQKATEQEAYLMQENVSYIEDRKPRTSLRYIRHKTLFTLENYRVIMHE